LRMLGAVQAPLAGCQLLTLVLRLQAATTVVVACPWALPVDAAHRLSRACMPHAFKGGVMLVPATQGHPGSRGLGYLVVEKGARRIRTHWQASRLVLLILAGGRAPHGHSTHAQAVPLQPAGPQPALSAAGPEGTAVAACSLAQRARAAARRAAGGVRGQYGARPRRTRPRLRAACGLLARCVHGSAARQCLLP